MPQADILQPCHVALACPQAASVNENKAQQIKMNQVGMRRENAESASSGNRDGDVQTLSPAQDADKIE